MGSLELDFSGALEMAMGFDNAMWPFVVIPIGLIVGFGLIRMIMRIIRGTFTQYL
jgi:hypothetical protein